MLQENIMPNLLTNRIYTLYIVTITDGIK